MVRDKDGNVVASNFYIVNGNTKQVVSIPHNDSQQKCRTLEEMRNGFWTSANIVLGDGFILWWNDNTYKDFTLCEYEISIYTYQYHSNGSNQKIDQKDIGVPSIYVRFVSSPQYDDTSVTPVKKYANVDIYASSNNDFSDAVHMAKFKLCEKDFDVKVGSSYCTHCFVKFVVSLNDDATKISIYPSNIVWGRTTSTTGSLSDNPTLITRSCDTTFIKIDGSVLIRTASFNIPNLNTSIGNFSKRTNLNIHAWLHSNQYTSAPQPPLFYDDEEIQWKDGIPYAPVWPFRSRGVEKDVSFIHCAK